jgi:RNA polymerase sigma-70 factor (ECF subfamily)
MTKILPQPIRRRSQPTEAAGAPAGIAMSRPSHPAGERSAEACADCARRNDCEECFEELVRRFQTPLLHFLIRRIGSRHDAEDLLQESFLAAYRNLDRYKSAWRFSTWLFTIANRLAASSRRRKPVEANGQRVREFSGSDPLANAQASETRGKLWDAAREILEPDSFTALWLSYVESMPADQIGLVLGRNANAVRILLHRARARLAERL